MKYTFHDIRVDDGHVGIHVAHRDRGSELVFFLHGLGCSSETFRDVWIDSRFHDYSILCPDLPGFGRSSGAGGFSYRMEDFARVCAALLERVPHERLHIVGHSMGGAIALLLPEERRASIDSFANVEGNLNPEDCVFGSREASEASFETFEREVLTRFIESSDTWRAVGLSTASPRAFYESARSLVVWSDGGLLLQAFHELTVRKAYFYGEENASHPTVATVEGIDSFMIPEAGHFAMIDQPESFYGYLSRFIRG